MRLTLKTMDRNIDNAGLLGFGTVFGYLVTQKAVAMGFILAVPTWVTQPAISIATMVLGAVAIHFTKRVLRRWPIDPPGKDDDTDP